MSTQESLLVTKEMEAMLEKGTIQKTSVKRLLRQSLLSKPKGCEQHTWYKLKNLNVFIPYLLALIQEHAEREILNFQGRSEGCLLWCSPSLKTSEVHQFSVGKLIMSIPLSIFWPESSFSNFYYATEDPKSDSTKNQLSNHGLSGQYALNQPNNMILLLQQLGHIINKGQYYFQPRSWYYWG